MAFEDQDNNAMSAPPPEDFLKAMRMGVEATHFIQMRGRTIPVRILSIDEINGIRRAAIQWQATKSYDDTDRNLWTQKETLALATKMSAKEFPMLTTQFLGTLTLDEVGYLYEEYLHVMARFNPRVEDITAAEFNMIVDHVKKKNVGWNDLSLNQLRAIFIDWARLISQPEKLELPRGN